MQVQGIIHLDLNPSSDVSLEEALRSAAESIERSAMRMSGLRVYIDLHSFDLNEE